jgi:hypothetical protein
MSPEYSDDYNVWFAEFPYLCNNRKEIRQSLRTVYSVSKLRSISYKDIRMLKFRRYYRYSR